MMNDELSEDSELMDKNWNPQPREKAFFYLFISQAKLLF